MKTLKLLVEFKYDEELMHSGDNSKKEKDWFYKHILKNSKDLVLHSNEIGDEIGSVKVLTINLMKLPKTREDK